MGEMTYEEAVAIAQERELVVYFSPGMVEIEVTTILCKDDEFWEEISYLTAPDFISAMELMR